MMRVIAAFTIFIAILLGIFEISARQDGGSIVSMLPEVTVGYFTAVVVMCGWLFLGKLLELSRND